MEVFMEKNFKNTADDFLHGTKSLQPFCPFPQAGEREAYERLPRNFRDQLTAMGEGALGYPYPPLLATDFMAFGRSGNRTDYEDVYFARRYALNSLTVAECAEYKGRFLDDIINGIFALCEESAWQLPAHNSYRRDAARNLLPDSSRPILDLFACETGAQLACIFYLLGDKLDSVDPSITKRIREELERRIFLPYLREHFWWMGEGEEAMCNWTPWCTQNVLYAFFLCAGRYHDCAWTMEGYSGEEAARAILSKAAASCDYFLKDYGQDGCCDEGAQYYRHAGLCLDGAADVLNQVTGGSFTRLMHREKIKNMAAYIFNVHVHDQYYFNFADCSPVAGRAGVREYLFGKHTGQPTLMQFAAKDLRASGDDLFSDESGRLNLIYRMLTIFHYEEARTYSSPVPLTLPDIYYESVGLFLARSEVFSLAVKAGGNNDSHNHNDTGSIILYKNNQPIFADVGVGSYTQKTFSSKRYEIWTMQSGYHNLPTIDGMDQHEGADYRAKDVATSFEAAQTPVPENADTALTGEGSYRQQPDTAFISMELAGAYPLSDPGRSYVRKVTFHKKENRITLIDTTDSRDVILNFITYEEPEISGMRLTIGSADCNFQGAKLMVIERIPITDKRLQTAWKHDLYRIRLRMTASRFVLDIR